MAVNRPGDGRRTEEEARIVQLYRLASTEVPPVHIDAAIAAAARAPGKAAPQQRALAWWNTWRMPFAFAAVAVVSVSLVTLMMEDSERVASVPQTAPPVVAERGLARSQPEAADPATPQAREREPERRQGSDGSSRPNEAAMPPAPPLDTTQARRKSREDAPAQHTPPRAAETGVGTVQKAAPTEAVPRRVDAPAPVAQDRAPAIAGARARPEAQAGASEEIAPASPPARAAPKAAFGMRALESERPAAPGSRLSPEVAAHILQLEGREPSMWIERIVALRRDGRRAEADGLLAEFKRRYPEETLPASLQ